MTYKEHRLTLEAKPYFDRGSSYFDSGDWTSAIQEFSHVINLTPKLGMGYSAYSQRGLAYFNLGRYNEARPDLEKALRSNFGNNETRDSIRKKLAEIDRIEKAPEKEAFERLRAAAAQGDVEAQFNVGRSYFTGQGVTRDYANAAEWFGKAAVQGHAEAKDFLAKAEAEKAREAKEKAEQKARRAKEAAERAAKEESDRKRGRIGFTIFYVFLIIVGFPLVVFGIFFVILNVGDVGGVLFSLIILGLGLFLAGKGIIGIKRKWTNNP